MYTHDGRAPITQSPRTTPSDGPPIPSPAPIREMLNSFVRLAKRLNWSLRRWSTARDRVFHDALFSGKTYDPFSPAYPGFLTIRRFADLAEPHVGPADRVLDLGCGPGEITNEMARRLPGSEFIGIDHSAEALIRAEQLAHSLGLTNAHFELHDLEAFTPPHRVGLVTMFDAFHHVLDPERLIRSLGERCDRFFLIEPAGNSFGQWQRTVDLDWLSEALFTIRDRLEYQFGVTVAAQPGAALTAPAAGEPTERRYAMEDFLRFFAGFGVDVQGTVAGLELYGVDPYAKNQIREDIGNVVYKLVVELERVLRHNDLDLASKHWAVYAERGWHAPTRRLPNMPKRVVQRALAGAYGAAYERFGGPLDARAGMLISASVQAVNRGWREWNSAADQPIFLSYHWLDATDRMIVEDGLRSPLPRVIGPGDSEVIAFQIQCPQDPGLYILAVDLVHEHVTWFSRAGVPPLRVPVQVRR